MLRKHIILWNKNHFAEYNALEHDYVFEQCLALSVHSFWLGVRFLGQIFVNSILAV